ncbi:MAG: methyltransferase domain-containing protein [Pseudomonadota bacterium]
MSGNGVKRGLDTVYELNSADEAQAFYDGWAARYDVELIDSGYITPTRCAEALAAHASLPWAPLIEFGCGTGLGGEALRAAGFECIDGTDIAEEMLAKARAKDLYRELSILDLTGPIGIEPGTYQNAAAIGVINPAHMPATVLDEMISVLPAGGCLVYSLNDKAAADRSVETRLFELVEHMVVELVFKEHGPHIPEIDLFGTVYVVRKR